MENNTSVWQVTVKGNPHTFSARISGFESPFYQKKVSASVAHREERGNEVKKVVGGIVEVFANEVLTPPQEKYLNDHPMVLGYKLVYRGQL